MNISGITDCAPLSVACDKVSFQIVGTFGTFKIYNAVSISSVKFPAQSISRELVRHIAKFESIFLQPYDNVRPSVLIGQDNWHLLCAKETRSVGSLGLSLTPLGWVLHGTAEPQARIGALTHATDVKSVNINTCDCDTSRLEKLIELHFQLDNLGVSEKIKLSARIENSLNILKRTTRRIGDAWETGLLWKAQKAPQVDSRATALKRLFSLEKRLDKDHNYASLYYNEMSRLIANGYAEEAHDDGAKTRIWHLPHFGVINANKPGKIRLVFDAAAKTAGHSLNDQLDAGPDLIQSLIGILTRFRQHAIGVKGDIRDMYMRVGVREPDRGALRFLWRAADRKGHPRTYEMTRLVFGANSSPCSALYVRNANATDFEQERPEAARSIIQNSYVDDYISSCKSIAEARALVGDVIYINARGNFPMHGWASNSEGALKDIPACARAPVASGTRLCNVGIERVLGLHWNTCNDTLECAVDCARIDRGLISGNRKPTKREVLSITMSVFDPLGFWCPFTIKSKIIMQDVWRSAVDWDETIRDEEGAGWAVWLRSLENLPNYRVPRCLTDTSASYDSAELHAFCDASLKAYAAVVYLRFTRRNSPAHTALVLAKSRVSPLKPLSIPRLELQAALLGARLLRTVEKEIDIKADKRFLWSDSVTVIRWIKTEPRTRNMYVAHRLGEINELTLNSEWRWVPTGANPADCATRGVADAKETIDLWFNGPDFLKHAATEWPIEKSLAAEEKRIIDNMEIRQAQVCVTIARHTDLPLTGRLLGWRGLLAVARRVRAFATRWRDKLERITETSQSEGAVEYWIREIQSQSFPEELRAARHGTSMVKNSPIANVRPFVDGVGLLRAMGRVTKLLGVNFNNNPIILEGKHPATRLLLRDYHLRFRHGSNETIINELRENYYITRVRQVLKSITYNCLSCKLRRAKPRIPLMASLPLGRVAYKQRPFSHCGIDYFGPMWVKIGRRREKRWGVLMTCLTTRAVHLELAHTLSASSTILALQRLAARRGSPSVIYSDNGTNFRGTCTELKSEIQRINTDKQREYALRNGMKWIFNPPDAPHMGGAWERLIRSIKVALRATLNEQAPSEETLYTLLTEAEHSVNSRPLTHVSLDPRDDQALTPNHFLIGASSGEVKLDRLNPENVCLRKHWQIAQAFADAFWRRWLKEYLPTQISRPKWHTGCQPPDVGDFVLIIDYHAPRDTWKRGKIIALYPGDEGVIRVVKVRTDQGELVRPTHKLIPLFSEKKVQNETNFARSGEC